MSKAILMVLLALMSSSAAAEWVEVIRRGDGNTTIYADPATIRKSDNNVRMWIMLDYLNSKDAPGSLGTLKSLKSHDEFDCKEEKKRTLYMSAHGENMGRGEVIFSDTIIDRTWKPIAPDEIGSVLFEFACKKR